MPDLVLEVTKALRQYTQAVQDVLEDKAEEITKETVKQLKATSPKRTGRYSKAWIRKKTENGYVIHNKRYYLTHLLENGHAKRGGGRVAPVVHIAPAEESAVESFEKEVRRAINDID